MAKFTKSNVGHKTSKDRHFHFNFFQKLSQKILCHSSFTCIAIQTSVNEIHYRVTQNKNVKYSRKYTTAQKFKNTFNFWKIVRSWKRLEININ